MILKDDFYTVEQLVAEEGNIHATLRLNGKHRIFEGHFPEQPVVPGVCMIQMIKELLETVTGNRLLLRQSDTIKFLSVIDPTEGKPLLADISYNNIEDKGWQVTASLLIEERICLKLKAGFEINTSR